MSEQQQQAVHGGLTCSRPPLPLPLLCLLLLLMCLLPYPGATTSTTPSRATLRTLPKNTSTITIITTSGIKTTTSSTNTLSTQALKNTSISTTSTVNAISTSGIQKTPTSTSKLNPRALLGTSTSITSTINLRTGKVRRRVQRATTKSQYCPPLEADLRSKGGSHLELGKGKSSSPVPIMKDCAMNRRGFVVEAGVAEACRAEVMEPFECDPSQAVMVLVTLNEALNKNGSVQVHQMVEGGVLEVYLKEERPGSYNLYCIDSFTSEALDKVYAGFKVLDVEDFECRIHNLEELDCTWTRPYNPAQSENEDYLPTLCVDEAHKLCDCIDNTCSAATDLCMKECCRWDFSTLPIMTDANVSMVFWVTNSLMDSYTYFRHSFDPLAVVVPEAPQGVEVVVAGLDAEVTWLTPDALLDFPPCLTFLLDHRDASCPSCTWTTDVMGNCCAPECRSAARLEHWWRRYEVRVRLRSAAAPQPVEEDGWWSDWQPRHVNTSAAAPDAPPGVGPGSFQVAGRGFKGLNDLTFAWQTLPTLLHNGPDFGYLAQLCGGGDDDCGPRSEVLEEIAVTDNFAVFQNVSSSASHTLRVSATNSKGAGPWAPVRVAEAAARPAPPLLPVVVQHARAGQQDVLYELRWASEGEGTYTVYLCTGEQEGARPCTGHLFWISVGNASATNLTLRDFGLQDASPPRVSFAVSAEDGAGASSGLSWDRCGAPQPYRNVRGPPEPDEPITNGSWVELPWTLSCSFWADVVEEAEATCCRGAHASPDSCTGERVTATGQPWTGVVRVEGLQAGEKYTAWLRLHYRVGASPWTDGQTFTTSRRPVLWWALVCGVVASVVVLMASVALLRRLRRRLNAGWKDFGRNINLPKGLFPENPEEKGEVEGGTGGTGNEEEKEGEGKKEAEQELSVTDSVSASDEEITSFRPSPRSLASPKHYLKEHQTKIYFETDSSGDQLECVPSSTASFTPSVPYISIQAAPTHPQSHLAEDTTPPGQNKVREDASNAYTAVSDISIFLADVPKATEEGMEGEVEFPSSATTDRSSSGPTEHPGHIGKGYVTLDHSLSYLSPSHVPYTSEQEVGVVKEEKAHNQTIDSQPWEDTSNAYTAISGLSMCLDDVPKATEEGIEGEVEFPSSATTDRSFFGPTEHPGHISKGYVTLDHSLCSLSPSHVPYISEQEVPVVMEEKDHNQTIDTQPTTGYCKVDDGVTPAHLPTT